MGGTGWRLLCSPPRSDLAPGVGSCKTATLCSPWKWANATNQGTFIVCGLSRSGVRKHFPYSHRENTLGAGGHSVSCNHSALPLSHENNTQATEGERVFSNNGSSCRPQCASPWTQRKEVMEKTLSTHIRLTRGLCPQPSHCC